MYRGRRFSWEKSSDLGFVHFEVSYISFQVLMAPLECQIQEGTEKLQTNFKIAVERARRGPVWRGEVEE